MNEDIANEVVLDPRIKENTVLEQPVASSHGRSNKDFEAVDLAKHLHKGQLHTNLHTKKNSLAP